MAEKEYIEREAAIKEFSNNGSIFVYGKQHCKAIVSRLNSIPAADVRPVVLCRDCLHYEMGVCLKIYDDGAANKDAWQERKPDDYCSYGEDRNVHTKETEEVSAVRCWLTNGADMRPTSMSGANGEES